MKTPSLGSGEDHHLHIAHDHERRALLASLIDSSEDAVYSKDTHGNITSWNPAAERLYGYAAREAIGRSIRLIIPPHRSGEEKAILDRTLVGERIPHYETERLARSGRIVPVALTISPIRNAAGRITGASVIARDISAQREAEQSAALFAAVVQSSQDAIVFRKPDNTIASWNPAAERLYGYTPDEIMGKHTTILIPTTRAGEDLRILERVLAGEAVGPYETERLAKDGRIVSVSLTVWPVRDAQGNIMGASSSAQDITVRKDMESKLALAERLALDHERLAILGNLTVGLTRELEGPLVAMRFNAGAIRSDLQALQSSGDAPSRRLSNALQANDQLTEALTHMENVMGGLRYVSVPGKEPKTYVDPRALTDHVLLAVRSILPDHIQIRRDEQAVHSILGRPGDLSIALLNLLVNAVEATQKLPAGLITLRTRDHTDAVIFAVTDNGPGIPLEHHKRVFNPFFTTKPKGSGLSLYAARQIVADHGGHLTFASIPEQATTFTIELPYRPAANP